MRISIFVVEMRTFFAEVPGTMHKTLLRLTFIINQNNLLHLFWYYILYYYFTYLILSAFNAHLFILRLQCIVLLSVENITFVAHFILHAKPSCISSLCIQYPAVYLAFAIYYIIIYWKITFIVYFILRAKTLSYWLS